MGGSGGLLGQQAGLDPLPAVEFPAHGLAGAGVEVEHLAGGIPGHGDAVAGRREGQPRGQEWEQRRHSTSAITRMPTL